MLIKGKTNSEIAFTFNRSIRTIEDHRGRIMQKLQVDNVVELIQKVTSPTVLLILED